jgi:hypothetical protein
MDAALLPAGAGILSPPGEERGLLRPEFDPIMADMARMPIHHRTRGGLDMRHSDSTERARGWVVDYSAARAKAIEWLGDRYLLAKPVNRIAAASRAHRGPRLATAMDRP